MTYRNRQNLANFQSNTWEITILFLIRGLPVPVGSMQQEGNLSKARLVNGIQKGKLAEKEGTSDQYL